MDKLILQVECLVQAQTFETLWAYYSQSGGQVYNKECRETAIRFVSSYENLSKIDPRILEPKELAIGEHSNVAEIIQRLKDWANDSTIIPYENIFESRFFLFALFTGVKKLILRDIGVALPKMTLSTVEYEYSARAIRWRGHLPRFVVLHDPDLIFSQASETPTIAVVGDIRRSQDLMTYAQGPKNFSERMVHFITTTRELIEKHAGFFDKFTGDGFLVYFNEAICKAAGLNYIDCFLNFLKEEIEFAAPLFQDWSRTIRKRPTAEIGLAIGADLGTISFEDIHDHLVAVGDSIVWASRMASIANSNEIIVNNLLHTLLDGRERLAFIEQKGQTKAGESFLGQKLLFDDISSEVKA